MGPDEFTLRLLTREQIQSLPYGTVLYSFDGSMAVVGRDYLGLDTRFGYTVWGISRPRYNQSPTGTYNEMF